MVVIMVVIQRNAVKTVPRTAAIPAPVMPLVIPAEVFKSELSAKKNRHLNFTVPVFF